MMITRFALLYSIVYTSIIAFVAALWLQGYIFIPNIPYFYLAISIVFVIQCKCFCRYHMEKSMCKLYAINLLINVVFLFKADILICTQYLQIFHCLVILFSVKNYWDNRGNLLLFVTSFLTYIIGIVHLSKEIIVPFSKMLIVSISSLVLSLCLIVEMYPRIQVSGDYISFGNPNDAQFIDANSYAISSKINLGFGYFVKLGNKN